SGWFIDLHESTSIGVQAPFEVLVLDAESINMFPVVECFPNRRIYTVYRNTVKIIRLKIIFADKLCIESQYPYILTPIYDDIVNSVINNAFGIMGAVAIHPHFVTVITT